MRVCPTSRGEPPSAQDSMISAGSLRDGFTGRRSVVGVPQMSPASRTASNQGYLQAHPLKTGLTMHIENWGTHVNSFMQED